MIIFVDIDGVLCTQDKYNPLAYPTAKPIKRNITKINKMFDKGHTIILWTARGGTTKLNWRSLTEWQLCEWGVKYHELRLDKPPYDMFIDDKALDIDRLDPESLYE